MKLKVKPIYIFLVAALLCLTGALIGVFWACSKTDYEPDYHSSIYKSFKINIPRSWECVYCNDLQEVWMGEGPVYYVFEVDERDGQFFSEFSGVKDEELEEFINRKIDNVFETESPVNREYLPDLNQSYECFKMNKYGYEPFDPLSRGNFGMVYQEQRLYVLAAY